MVISGQQRLVSRSLWDTDLPIDNLERDQQTIHHSNGPESQSLLIVTNGYQKQGQLISIAIAENLDPLKASIKRFQIMYAAISLFGLILLLAIQRWIIQCALLPLKKIQNDIAKLERGEISQLSTQGPEEIAPLINELNEGSDCSDCGREKSTRITGLLEEELVLLSEKIVLC